MYFLSSFMKSISLFGLTLSLVILAACTPVADRADPTSTPTPTVDDNAIESELEASFPDDIPPPPPPPPLTPDNIAGFEDLPPEMQESLREAIEASPSPTSESAPTDTDDEDSFSNNEDDSPVDDDEESAPIED